MASAPAVGAPGQMASGVGTMVAGGACDCSCLCAPGSFPNMAQMGQAPAAVPAVGTTMSTLTSAAIVQVTNGAGAPPPAAAPAQQGTLTNPAIVKGTPAAQVPPPPAPPAPQPQAQSSSAPVAQPQVQPTPSPTPPAPAPAPAAQQGASTIELSVSAPLGEAAAVANPSSTANAADAAANAAAAINIATFSLTSSLVLGNLAATTSAPKT